MKTEIKLTNEEVNLMYNILINKMEYKKEDLINPNGSTKLTLDNLVKFSICYWCDKLSEKVIKKYNLKDTIKSLKSKLK